jgi:hypothetical protein
VQVPAVDHQVMGIERVEVDVREDDSPLFALGTGIATLILFSFLSIASPPVWVIAAPATEWCFHGQTYLAIPTGRPFISLWFRA